MPPTGYSGDSGVVVGFGTTVIGGANQVIFDLHIPYDSAMRDTTLVGTAVTLSGMSTGDYFIVRNSNVGSATTSLGTDNSTVVGVGNSFADSVYVVKSTELHTRSVVGVNTTILRVFSNVTSLPSGISGITTAPFFGEYSWGKITLQARTKDISYPAHTLSGIGTNGLTGISTSSKVYRTKYVRFKKFT